jgi:hypothetical protein
MGPSTTQGLISYDIVAAFGSQSTGKRKILFFHFSLEILPRWSKMGDIWGCGRCACYFNFHANQASSIDILLNHLFGATLNVTDETRRQKARPLVTWRFKFSPTRSSYTPSYCLVIPSCSFTCSPHAARRTRAYGYTVLKLLYSSNEGRRS